MALAAPVSAHVFAPEFQVQVDGQPAPRGLRPSISSITYQTGLEGADRVELTIANDGLRWLDHPLLALDHELTVSIGYAPDPLTQMFVGEIVGLSPTFPSGATPSLVVTAQDRRQRLQRGTRVRWFAVPTTCLGAFPLPDRAVASLVSLEQQLIPIFDPVTAAIAVLIGGIEFAVAYSDPDAMQKLIRKQVGETDYQFLQRLGLENGWEMVMEHSGPTGGHRLRFFSLASRLSPEVFLQYGRSLVDFTPRVSTVGQVAAVSATFWRPEMKMEFTVTVSWDWDRSALDLNISPGYGNSTLARSDVGESAESGSITLVEEPVNQYTAPRVILSKLVSRLNQRLTGSGSTVGNPRIQAGTVLQVEGLGEKFGGLYRVTSATHTVDSGGYRTSFEVRKEIWFGSIPLFEQGAVRVGVHGQRIGRR
jgi:uncharacterized protein